MSSLGAHTIAGVYEATTSPATYQHDRLVVSGTATLNGALVLTLVNGYAPVLGDSVTIVTAGARVDTFTTVSGVSIVVSALFPWLTVGPAMTVINLILVIQNFMTQCLLCRSSFPVYYNRTICTGRFGYGFLW